MRELTVAQAIVIGSFVIGAFVATGIYLGLRPRPPETTAPMVATAVAPPGALPPAPPIASREQVIADARRALEAERPALVEACARGPARPSGGPAPAPSIVKYVFSFSFDASGVQLGRGMTEDPSTPSPLVTRCVAQQLQPLHIAPPGAPVSVDVPFQLP